MTNGSVTTGSLKNSIRRKAKAHNNPILAVNETANDVFIFINKLLSILCPLDHEHFHLLTAGRQFQTKLGRQGLPDGVAL